MLAAITVLLITMPQIALTWQGGQAMPVRLLIGRRLVRHPWVSPHTEPLLTLFLVGMPDKRILFSLQ